jgi:hypothetical protein
MTLTTSDILQTILVALQKVKANISLNKQWLDCRDEISLPLVSLFIMEETPLENKGACYKQDLTGQVEGFIDSNKSDAIYDFANSIKRALLMTTLSLSYQGYEISLPEDGARIARVQVKFKVIYFENIGEGR